MKAKSINAETVIFVSLLYKSFKSAILVSFVEHRSFLQGFGSSFIAYLRRKSDRLSIEIPTRMKTGWHGLTHKVGVWLAGIYPNEN